jgi:nucleotide-binding universal stress UspA family protein
MTWFRSILVAADFSGQSRAAFDVACSLADEKQSRLNVLHVVEPMPGAEWPGSFGEVYTMPLDDEGRIPVVALQEKLRGSYAPNRPIDTSYHVGEGIVADEILREAQAVGAELIVMGTHGRTGLRRLLAGSVAEAVLRRARCPVLALHSPEPVAAARAIAVILHPTDLSESSEPALRAARWLACDRGARLVLLYVTPPPLLAEGSMNITLDDPQVYGAALDAMRRRLDGPDLEQSIETRTGQGDAAREILRTAHEISSDLIVMGTHGRTSVWRLLMGSVAEAVLRRASCPVLVLRSHRAESSATADQPTEKGTAGA